MQRSNRLSQQPEARCTGYLSPAASAPSATATAGSPTGESAAAARPRRRGDRRSEIAREALQRRGEHTRVERAAPDVPRGGLLAHVDVLEGAGPAIHAPEHDRVRQIVREDVLAFREALALGLRDLHVAAEAERTPMQVRSGRGLRGHDRRNTQRDEPNDDDRHADESRPERPTEEPREDRTCDDDEHAEPGVSLTNAIGPRREPLAIVGIVIELALGAPQRGHEVGPKL